ncbi:hypothetical protein N9A08_01340 [Arthrobacter koreensis]|uniref:Uncharacterized protein n=1 Tax=Arthrobacter koreensis TaxID=199136 RepID=A0ABY6FU99_9MICC|nr:hypothetical protein [Arthrobacter koreensis]UYB36362.1 hypothetical protein N9A08_01340 [Arthrobacter koreensis]
MLIVGGEDSLTAARGILSDDSQDSHPRFSGSSTRRFIVGEEALGQLLRRPG